MTDATRVQQATVTPAIPARRCRTDAERLADMQAELAKLKAAGEAKAVAAKEREPKTVWRKQPRPKAKRVAVQHRDESDLDSELRDLVDGFVAALRDVIRRELIAQATGSLMSR